MPSNVRQALENMIWPNGKELVNIGVYIKMTVVPSCTVMTRHSAVNDNCRSPVPPIGMKNTSLLH